MSKRPNTIGGEYLVSQSFPEGKGSLSLTENMYRDYTTDTDCIESFPGYRKLCALGERIFGIFPDSRDGSMHYLVHAGSTLYRCSFADEFLDSMTSEVICDLAPKKSSFYRHGECIYIFDSEDVTVIDSDLDARKISETEDLAYVPTTYKNEEEYEQLNLLTNHFYEEFFIGDPDDISYETPGLLYKITNESKGCCAVVGCKSDIRGRLDIPGRARINGKYYRVTEIAPFAFRGRTAITKLFVGAYVEKIGEEAFYGCTALANAMCGEGLVEIGNRTFEKCTSLSRIYLGAKCESIGYNAFNGCESLTMVYYFGTSESIGYITGVEEIASCTIYFKCTYTDRCVGIPLCTPTDEILTVSLDGEEIGFVGDCLNGTVRLTYNNASDLAGKLVRIYGIADFTTQIFSKRKASFSQLFLETATGNEAILSATRAMEFDGRYHVFGSELFPNLIFSSSYTKEGRIHPLYFGALDYTILGSADSKITSMCSIGSRLVAVKRGEEHRGRIYMMRAEGEEFSLFGRRLTVKQTMNNADILSEGYSFDGRLIFLSGRGIMSLTYGSDIAEPTLENLTEDFTSRIDPDDFSQPIFSTLSGYLAVFGGGRLLLGDKRQSYKSDGGDTQLRWYRITDVQSHVGETPVYYYASTAPNGFFIHVNEGKPAEGVVSSYVDDEGVTRYYATVGIMRFAVVPGDELQGGEGAAVSAICDKEMSLIFGTEAGDIFAFNTDKRGVPPREIYEAEDYSEEDYKAHFGRVIHPYHYSADRHRIPYRVETKATDGGIPYLEKSTKRGSLTVRIERRSAAMVNVTAVTDSDRVCQSVIFPLGSLDFSDFDFEKVVLTPQSIETHMLPEKERNWVKKQIIVYTDDYLAPFAIQSLSYIFKTKGRIKNR